MFRSAIVLTGLLLASALVVQAEPLQAPRPRPMAELPADHPAYAILNRAFGTGIWPTEAGPRPDLSGPITRLEAARAVNVLMQTWTDPVTKRLFAAQDIANLESMALEFTSEMSLVSVRVGDLEDRIAALQRDVKSLQSRRRRLRLP